MIDFTGKVAIVTGSTRGIGRQIALQLAELGAKVVLSSRNAEDCERVQKEFESLGHSCLGFAADVSSAADCKALAAAAIEGFGQVDILVNNAGITRDNLMMRMKEDQWDDIMNINLKKCLQHVPGIASKFLEITSWSNNKYYFCCRSNGECRSG